MKKLLNIIVIILINCILINCDTDDNGDDNNNMFCDGPPVKCQGPFIVSRNNGRIISHPLVRQSPYSANMNCSWLIMAPPQMLILVQITYLSIEYSTNCQNDHLLFEEMNDNHTTTKLCGSTTPIKRYLSKSNQLILKMISDNTLEKLGFQLRYLFINNTDVEQLNLNINGVCDDAKEWKCNNNNDRSRCISKSWLCDGIKDCDDGSDESDCTTFNCAITTVKCDGKCILDEKFCGDFRKCPELKLIELPPPPYNTSIPHPPPRGECSKQFIPIIERRIVGGIVARPGSWPWTVEVRLNNMPWCGGTIVTNQWIVTAAHCVHGKENMPFTIHAGGHATMGNEPTRQVIRAGKVIPNQEYVAGTFNNDIAMLKLSQPLQFSQHVQPACVATTLQPFFSNGASCYALGWGNTKGTGGEGYLKQVKVPLIPHQQCNSWYMNRITDKMICAGYEQGGRDSCQGDSGGPLVCQVSNSQPKFYLAGVVSWGEGCAQPRKPGVYAQAPQFFNWMKAVIQRY